MNNTISWYSAMLMDHYHNPRLVGILVDPHFSVESVNEACGDIIGITGIIEKGVIADVRQQGSGCILSQSCASLLAEYALKKPLATVLSLTASEFCGLAQIEVGPSRLRCAVMALQALQKGVEGYVRPN